MKKKYFGVIIIALVVLIGSVTYAALGSYMGNHVKVESVIGTVDHAVSTEGSTTASVPAEELNGKWDIASGSKVYWSVTTSKETVNFVNEGVTGAWTMDVNNPTVMTGEGVVDMNALDSGNSQRDNHVKERSDLLEVDTYPEATFVTQSFSALPEEWTEGTPVPLIIEGKLKVKGMEKDVKFESEAMYKDGQLLLSAKTKVTFTDFGMQSPHTIVLDTENDVAIQLELVLNKA